MINNENKINYKSYVTQNHCNYIDLVYSYQMHPILWLVKTFLKNIIHRHLSPQIIIIE